MDESLSLREYYKYCGMAVLLGLSGSMAGAFAYQSRFTMVTAASFARKTFHLDPFQVFIWVVLIFTPLVGAYLSAPLTRKKSFLALIFVFSLIPGVMNELIFAFAHFKILPAFPFLFTLISYVFPLWGAIAAGLFVPASFTLLFKIIPKPLLGYLLGLLFGLEAGSYFILNVLSSKIQPQVFLLIHPAILLFFILIGASVLLSLNEPEGEESQLPFSFGDYLNDCIEILAVDRDFRRFLYAEWLMSGQIVASAFLSLFLILIAGIPASELSNTYFFIVIGIVMGGVAFSGIADIYGPKALLIVSQALGIILMMSAWVVSTSSPKAAIHIIFVLSGLTVMTNTVSYSVMCLFSAPTREKSIYFAIAGVVVFPVLLILSFLAGYFLRTGFLTLQNLYVVSLVLMLAAILYIYFKVKNPEGFLEKREIEKEAEEVGNE